MIDLIQGQSRPCSCVWFSLNVFRLKCGRCPTCWGNFPDSDFMQPCETYGLLGALASKRQTSSPRSPVPASEADSDAPKRDTEWSLRLFDGRSGIRLSQTRGAACIVPELCDFPNQLCSWKYEEV